MTADPNSLAALAPGDRIEALRRRMASIPARTDGAATPAVPVEHGDARFETRPETITESATSVLEVPPALADLLPRGGLARGSVVSVDGALSVLLGLLASVTGSGKHAAIIGVPKLGLLAATEMGADLARCALIPTPGSAAIDVAAILLDGMIWLSSDWPVPPFRRPGRVGLSDITPVEDNAAKSCHWVVNEVTGKPRQGQKFSPATRAHAETVLRAFYDFH